MRRFMYCLGAVLGFAATGAQPAAAQETLAMADRAPRFLLTSASGVQPVDVSRTALLRRRISLELRDVTLGEALAAIGRVSGLKLGYSRKVVPVTRVVRLVAEDITVAGALSEVLFDTGTDVLFERDGQAAIVSRPSPLERQTGTINGTVTDRDTGAPIAGALITVQGTRHEAAAGEDGRYRIEEVDAGTYVARARFIGYEQASVSVTVIAGEQVVADFALIRSVQMLNEVVTTGTLIPTEAKALPTPVSIIREEEIALQRPETVQELIRRSVPTIVGWDYSAFPHQTPFSARGGSSLSPGTGQMKVFVDGIEAAYASIAPVDPSSIERVEVLRGPQAAAIYGSDAIGGVIQIFTKRGTLALAGPQVAAQSALGLVETPYQGAGGVVRQQYTASLRGQEPTVGYHLGGSYSRTAEYLPDDEISAQSSPGVHGGINYTQGILSLDLSGRYTRHSLSSVFNPDLAATGFSLFTKPQFQPVQVRNQTIGGKLEVRARPWWRHGITLGIDRYSQDNVQSRPRLTTPSDTLLSIQSSGRTKNYIAYHTSVNGALTSALSGSITAGFDHYDLDLSQWLTPGALNTTGTIRTDPNLPASASLSTTTNTGYFVQAQVDVADRLFLTGGVRLEQNSNFGESLNTPVSPRVGASYVVPAGGMTLKARASFGRSIRAPSPGDKLAFIGTTLLVLANPDLGPERQHGWDAGVDLSHPRLGSLGLTYYDQIADDLIQQVFLSATPLQTYQFQNVGRVSNKGFEAELASVVGPLQFRGQYGFARARVDRLAPNYAGDLRIGDQILGTPRHTAGASLSALPFEGTSLTGAVTYVGSWRYYDFMALFGCFGGGSPCAPSNRDYIVDYPAIAKINLTASHRLVAGITGFVSVDNVTNELGSELGNSTPVFGRITSIGLRIEQVTDR